MPNIQHHLHAGAFNFDLEVEVAAIEDNGTVTRVTYRTEAGNTYTLELPSDDAERETVGAIIEQYPYCTEMARIDVLESARDHGPDLWMKHEPDGEVTRSLVHDGLIILAGNPETGTSFTITKAGLDLVS